MKTLAKPIQMISWTESDGRIHPLRFKVEEEGGACRVFRILGLHSTEPDRVAGNKVLKFVCGIVVDGTEKVCELRYDLDSCRWILFKL
ncbi:hypothetical protein [Anaerotalea alkaliphila]|uniref:Uncharacterized protein n=1 Tax=Anaerotalea alkaliphila TaxID=2662126 RepID=A0A7X5KM37_9FIRM|nr:hypothetical protein [Anaerotalea alkaliphila]NDL67384.1 hypothetical protein [Anaerotalea alkaliphila]